VLDPASSATTPAQQNDKSDCQRRKAFLVFIKIFTSWNGSFPLLESDTSSRIGSVDYLSLIAPRGPKGGEASSEVHL
jgi:hypothetical protein